MTFACVASSTPHFRIFSNISYEQCSAPEQRAVSFKRISFSFMQLINLSESGKALVNRFASETDKVLVNRDASDGVFYLTESTP